MRFSLRRKQSGIFFAIWPRRTVDGELHNGWLRWERVLIPGWGWGSGDEYYYRYICARAQSYATPPNPEVYCTNHRTNGPTPCYYPSCKWTDEEGTQRCGIDHVAFGEM